MSSAEPAVAQLHTAFLLGIDPGVELLGHVVTLGLTFLTNAKLFSKVAVPLYIPTNNV